MTGQYLGLKWIKTGLKSTFVQVRKMIEIGVVLMSVSIAQWIKLWACGKSEVQFPARMLETNRIIKYSLSCLMPLYRGDLHVKSNILIPMLTDDTHFTHCLVLDVQLKNCVGFQLFAPKFHPPPTKFLYKMLYKDAYM